ncbi:MAG: hypothetical protein RMK89_11455 [Armatimonadota bacterium]|nr:hypothetical protein [Armatimonadota bacterium]MDW8144064.1 hypothetical protein [Armatimonadota bacterium]
MRWIAFWVLDLWLYCKDVRSWVIERVVVRGLFSLRQENAPQKGLHRLLLRLGLKRSP